VRDDIKGAVRAPESIQEFLENYGGRTPNGEPMWRLVLCSSVYWKLAGDFKIWDERVPLNERGGIDMWHGGKQFDTRPIRVESGMVERRKYPHIEGWILQKWFPSSFYSKAFWEAPENAMFDGTPKLGPWPQFGDYELMSGPYERVPTTDKLRDEIAEYHNRIETAPASIEQRTLLALAAAQEEEDQYAARLDAKLDAFIRDRSTYIKSSSLEAGRIRTELAKRCGITEHVGA
jgi:hypothetical protein